MVDVDFSDGLDAVEEKEVLGRLETLNAIGVALSSERDVLTLMTSPFWSRVKRTSLDSNSIAPRFSRAFASTW